MSSVSGIKMARVCFFIIFFLLSCPLAALYVGNPALPSLIEEGFFLIKENKVAIKLGYERDWLLDRPMKLASHLSGRFDRFKALSDQGVLVLNLLDRYEIYGQAGATSFFAEHRPAADVQNRYQSYNQFTWGLGARALLASWGSCFLGVDIEYQRASPEIKWLTKNGAPIPPLSSSKVTSSEWQVALGFGYQISFFYPYIAVKYADNCVTFKNLPTGFIAGTNRFSMKNRRRLGLALGASLSTGSCFGVSIEARFIDDQAVTLAAKIKL
ncbi:MAG: hypothetical protein AAF443_05510 [Chlamydiota bacterium]